jgi:hypothetical protein
MGPAPQTRTLLPRDTPALLQACTPKHQKCHLEKDSRFQKGMHYELFQALLRSRNYYLRLRYRFRILTSYGSGSGSDFRQASVPAPYLDHKKHIFQKNVCKKSCLFTFYTKKIDKFHKKC